MLLALLISACGMLAGLVLLRRVPVIPRTSACATLPRLTVIIPARNEAETLPELLRSLYQDDLTPDEVLVVDDDSTDATAAVAAQYGARVLRSAPLPHGWTGKTWSCQQGALAASGDVLCFLDADTRFDAGGYGRLVQYFAGMGKDAVLSVLPFHRTRCRWEQLSLFFNVVLAMGASGFGGVDAPHLFGQTLILPRTMYFAAGGHEAVRGEVLENLHLAAAIETAGGHLVTVSGRGTLWMRMFPEGFEQLCASWRKGFATGARASSPLALWISVYWLSSLATIVVLVPLAGELKPIAMMLYCFAVLQVGWYGQQLGTFSWITALAYPGYLAFYFAIFGQSAWHRRLGHATVWRGRQV